MATSKHNSKLARQIVREKMREKSMARKELPMDQYTSRDEILHRFNDGERKAFYHIQRVHEKNRLEPMDDVLPGLLREYNIGGWRTLGTAEWVSSRNGDRWIAFAAEKTIKMPEGGYGVTAGYGSLYYRPTLGSFDMAWRNTLGGVNADGSLFTILLTAFMTSHAMLRLRQRLNIEHISDIELMLFAAVMCQYSFVYETDNDFVISNDLGEFWGEKTKHEVDILYTFVSVEEMTPQNKMRYEHYRNLYRRSKKEHDKQCEQSLLQSLLALPLGSDAVARYTQEHGLSGSASVSVMPYGSPAALLHTTYRPKSATESALPDAIGNKLTK